MVPRTDEIGVPYKYGVVPDYSSYNTGYSMIFIEKLGFGKKHQYDYTGGTKIWPIHYNSGVKIWEDEN